MKCKPLYVGKNTIGDRFDNDAVFVFFSNKNFSEKEFYRLFPDSKLNLLKQVHGNRVIPISSKLLSSVEADAQITQTPGLSLGVYTGDCLPIMYYDPSTKTVAAAHAGWRGVVQKIAPLTLEQFKDSRPEEIRVWIGPHIQKQSFEVHFDVAEQLQKSYPGTQQVVFNHPHDSQKRFVDLSEIVKGQLISKGVLPSNIWCSNIDTFKDNNYHSYRRQGSGGRQISFINLTM